jgi:hypothetical protein
MSDLYIYSEYNHESSTVTSRALRYDEIELVSHVDSLTTADDSVRFSARRLAVLITSDPGLYGQGLARCGCGRSLDITRQDTFEIPGKSFAYLTVYRVREFA